MIMIFWKPVKELVFKIFWFFEKKAKSSTKNVIGVFLDFDILIMHILLVEMSTLKWSIIVEGLFLIKPLKNKNNGIF